MQKSAYNLVLEQDKSTVVAKYIPEGSASKDYQSEADLEKSFIEILEKQGYEYIKIKEEKNLIDNLRLQLEKLNDFKFSDIEWQTFWTKYLANANEGIVEKTRTIQEDFIKVLRKDDGSSQNIYLIDKTNIHKNTLQVLNQYETDEGIHKNRYDVTVLVNGLPLVHIELKRRGVDLKEAFNQIKRYQNESFWAGSGLFEFVQLFVISNGTLTKYYSNTTRNAHLKEEQNQSKKSGKKTLNSFEFTSWWADGANQPIRDLTGFAKTFFSKHTILAILTRYCVFTSEEMLLAMRPYQIAATEKILNRILCSTNAKTLGTLQAGGYIWHTTGSGKTLTSFKTAQLASKMEDVKKVLFVVDRKDLDYQTMKEYDKFQQGAANSNTSTKVLEKQMKDPNAKIIITTIQKLSNFITRNKEDEIFSGHLVLIFDECHRSQFGDMHTAITKAFKNYHLFGFTGTPIFSQNAGSGKNVKLKTTEQAFGDKLHTYTIVDAINDKNVLPFRVEYHKTFDEKEQIEDKKVSAIDTEKVWNAPERISLITKYILEHFNQKTKRNENSFAFNKLLNVEELATTKHKEKIKEIKESTRLKGFNSIFATQSIATAKAYYAEFKKQQSEKAGEKLKIATIYSFGINEDLDDLGNDGIIDENSENVEGLDKSSREFLDEAIADYNKLFKTKYSTDGEGFQNYYKDLSMRIKNREVDLVIVVNMFLTGFDATTLNTLWVDKNLRQHGLLQAFSRTNRILNSVKTFGNIICFRNLEKATNDAIALFGNKEASGLVLLKPFQDYYDDFEKRIAELIQKYPLENQIIGEEEKKQFIKDYGAILRVKNILQAFDEFEGKEILPPRDFQDYQSVYLDLYGEFRKTAPESENINDDIVFEIELLKQVEINIDYILMLVRKYQDGNCKDKEILVSIDKAVSSSFELRNKKDLIDNFIQSIKAGEDVDEYWKQFISGKKVAELAEIIREENLNEEETKEFVKRAFEDGFIPEAGTEITKILPPTSRFGKNNTHSEKKRTVLEKLKAFVERFLGL
ncbi:DEAD/DEAH box helicase [candidate division SR1 bacterium]|nr:DEAD/DEAH box helicase [candidate division SR1 bacterium]